MADTNTSIDWTSLLSGGLNLAANQYAANQATNAANTAAQMSQFRPVGITTRFGSSGFNYDPTTGQLIGAGYQVAPDVAAMREGLLGLSGSGLSQAQQAQAFQPQVTQAGQGLFNLGQQYIAQTPQQAAQNWMAQQQQLLAPGREQELARYTNAEYNRGTLGLGVGATREGYTVPQQQQALQSMPQVASAGPAMLSAPAETGLMLRGRTPPGVQVSAPVAQTPNPLAKPEGMPMPEMFTTQPFEGIMPAQAQVPAMQPKQSQGLEAANPRFAALYNARALQDAQLAAQAQQAGMEQARFGQGLLTGGMDVMRGGYGVQTAALQPYAAYQTQAQALEKAALDALTQGASLGSSAVNAQQQAAQRYLQGQQAQQSATQGAIAGLVDPVAQLISGLLK